MKLKKLIFGALIALAAAFAFVSCSNGSGEFSVTGTYVYSTTTTAETIVLKDNDSCTWYNGAEDYEYAGSISQKDSGTYSVSGSDISFSWGTKGSISGAISRDGNKKLTITDGGTEKTFYWQKKSTTIVY